MQKYKVIEISETLYEIPEIGHSVKIQVKKGRRLLICSCTNHGKFCNESPFCFHKELVLEFIKNKPILEKLDNLINSYEGFSNIKIKIEPRIPLEDLKELRNFITKK